MNPMTLLILGVAGAIGYLFLKKDQRPQTQPQPQQPMLPPSQIPTSKPPPGFQPTVPTVPFGQGGSPVIFTSAIPNVSISTGGNLGTAYNVRTDINVRQDPSASSSRIGGFTTGTTAISLGEAQGDWIKVTGLNVDTGMPVSGWVMKSYLDEQAIPSIPSGSSWMGEY